MSSWLKPEHLQAKRYVLNSTLNFFSVSLLSTTAHILCWGCTIQNTSNFWNHFHNILRLFNVLPNFPFTTSEAMSNNYLQTWHTKVASRVDEQLKTYDLTKLGDISISDSLVCSVPSKMRTLLILAKSSWKIDIKLFP